MNITKTPDMADGREKNNLTIFIVFSIIAGIASNICSEGYIQTYLIKLGFDTKGIGNYGIIYQIMSITAYMLLTRMPPVKKGIKKIYAAAVFCTGIFPAALAAAGYIPVFSAVYIIILSTAALFGFLTAFRAVTEYNMTPYLFSRKFYGTAVSKTMVISGLITVAISVCAGFLLKKDGTESYTYLFCIPPVILIVSAILVLLYKFDNDEIDESQSQPRITYSDVLKKITSVYYMKKLIPHFIRGAAMAGMYYIIPSALEKITLTDSERSFLIVVSVLATMTGSFIFMALNNKINSGIITYVSIIICAVLMPLLVICTEKYLFLVLYFIYFTSNIISQISIPTGVLRVTPNNELSLINSMRLLLMSLATSLFIFVFGILLKYIVPVYIMIFSGMIFISCGIMYKKQFKDNL